MILRLTQLALVLLAGGSIFAAATNTLGRVLQTSDVRRLARTIELNQIYRQGLAYQGKKLDYSVWIDPAVLSDVAASSATRMADSDCLVDTSRGALSVRLGLLDQAFLSEASDLRLRLLISKADEAVAKRLKCSPIDGNAWLLRARLGALQLSDVSNLGRLLDLSYFYAPAEEWIMILRLRFMSYMIDSGTNSIPPGFGADIARFIGLGRPMEVATLYADSGNGARGFMRAVIDRQRLDRRVQMLRRIDALGVSYPVPEACKSVSSNSTPGSELEMRRPADLIEACAK